MMTEEEFKQWTMGVKDAVNCESFLLVAYNDGNYEVITNVKKDDDVVYLLCDLLNGCSKEAAMAIACLMAENNAIIEKANEMADVMKGCDAVLDVGIKPFKS